MITFATSCGIIPKFSRSSSSQSSFPFQGGHFGGNPPYRGAEEVRDLPRASCTRSFRCECGGSIGRASGQEGEGYGMEAYPAPRVAAAVVPQSTS